MMTRHDLIVYLNELLESGKFKDYCPNGLQVEGKTEITKLVTGVTASLALIEAALAADADALLVHHGYFWKGEHPAVCGIKKQRLAKLLGADMNLLAYHLPLDAHPDYGNNAQLGRLWGIEDFAPLDSEMLVLQGAFAQARSGQWVADLLTNSLQRKPLHVPAERPIQRLAWCSGGAQGYIEAAVEAGVDAYISGEMSEQTTHIAREAGIHYFAAGHHATERYGVQALGEHLAEKFGIECVFVDIDNPA